MTRWLKNLLGFLIIGVLVWYLARHWGDLKPLISLRIDKLAAMFVLYFLTTLLGAGVIQRLLFGLGVKAPFWEMFLLNNAATALNYAPMRFGTVFRAHFLKAHYGLSYTRFVSFFLYITFLVTAIATGVGFIGLVGWYSLERYESKIMAVCLAAISIGSVLLLFIHIPSPKGTGRIATAMREFIVSRKELSKQWKLILTASGLLAVNFILTALITAVVYKSIGKEILPAGCLILGSLGYVVLFMSLTPGSLGVREAVLGFGAVVLGIPLEVGILAAMIDRAVAAVYSFTIGGASAIWLWRRQPQDFKNGN